MKKISDKFHDHWFAGYYLKDLTLIRLFIIGIQLYFLLFTNILITQKLRSLINIEEYEPVWILKILLAPFGWGVRPDYLFLEALWLGAIITGFLSAIGLYKRLSLFLFAAFNTILFAHKYSYMEQHHTEAIVIIFLWILAFGDSSKSWSLDDLKRRIIISVSTMKFRIRDKNEVDQFARWPVTLMQWMFCLVYLSAGYEKIKGGFNSYSLMSSFAQDGLAHNHDLGVLLSGYPDLLNVMVPLTLIFEFAFIIIMLFPGITWLFLLAGALFHVSIYFVHAPPFLHWPILYIIFIEPLRYTIQKKIKWRHNKSKWYLIYDGLCPLCIRTMTIINYFDLTNKINFIDLENDQAKIKAVKNDLKFEDLKHSMHLINPRGKTYYGFYAFRKLSMLLPVMWILIPVLYFPFVDKAGSFFYDKAAKSRKTVKCNIETCKTV